MKTILSAIQATAQPTLGNYLGAIRNWIPLQEDHRCYFFVVDLHALTGNHEPKQLKHNSLLSIATYLAAGLDPARSCLFLQSQIPEHSQLAWILNCHSYMGEMSRMTQFKDKSTQAGKNIKVGLFTYPILMAADILLYDVDQVPVGADQKQHIELTRNIAIRMNQQYGEDTFVVPQPLISKSGAKIMDLQNPSVKMSKSATSEKGVLFLGEPLKSIAKKIKSATTDSGAEIIYTDDKPGIKNLLEIQSKISGKSIDALVHSYQGKMYGHLKADTADIVCAEVEKVQIKTNEYMQDTAELLKIIHASVEKARTHARKTLERVHQKIGLPHTW